MSTVAEVKKVNGMSEKELNDMWKDFDIEGYQLSKKDSTDEVFVNIARSIATLIPYFEAVTDANNSEDNYELKRMIRNLKKEYTIAVSLI